MAGRQPAINPATNDDNTARTNMLDLWKASIEQSKKNSSAPTNLAKSQNESKSDLEERIRNGQAECPTCASRVYQDESNDGGVSFQAARHIAASTAGVTVMSHEHEHVSAGVAESREDGAVRKSTVALEYGKCPDCGKTYVKGGVTKTTTQPASYKQQSGGLDLNV